MLVKKREGLTDKRGGLVSKNEGLPGQESSSQRSGDVGMPQPNELVTWEISDDENREQVAAATVGEERLI